MLGRLSRTSIGLLAALGLSAIAYAVAVEPRTLRLRQFRIGIPELPDQIDGLRVAFLTDFHVGGPGSGDALTRQAIEIIAQEQPDLVLLGGDYVDNGHWSDDEKTFNGLMRFGSVLGVLGNHDYRGGEPIAEKIRAGLGRRGVVILQNESISVRMRNTDVTVGGVDDPYTGHDDICATLKRGSWPLVLLAHAPAIEKELTPGSAGLILCGHTHGGQVRLSPRRTLTILDSTFYLDRIFGRPVSQYQRGFHWVNGNLLYVSNGIGTTRLPIRFMAPPEITIFHLTQAVPHPDEPCDSAVRYVEDIG